MKSKPLTITLALLAILGAAFLFWHQFAGPRVNLKPSAAVGVILAEEVGRLLGGAGEVVILSRQVTHEGPDATRERVASLTAALQHHATLKLAPTEWVPRPPPGAMDLGAMAETKVN